MPDSADRERASHVLCTSLKRGLSLQGFDVLFYGDSITMRWRDDWPANEWGVGPPPAKFPGGTPMGIFNQTFRINFTSDILGIGSESWCADTLCALQTPMREHTHLTAALASARHW